MTDVCSLWEPHVAHLPATMALEDVVTHVLATASGTTRPLVERELRATIAEYLTRTLAWQPVQQVDLAAGDPDYDMPILTTRPYALGVSVLEASFNGIRVVPFGRLELRFVSRPESGAPRAVELLDGLRLRVYPTPSTSGTLYVQVALTITLDSTPLSPPPEPLVTAGEALKAGTLARLYSMDGRPWSNGPLARVAFSRFHSLMAMDRATVASGRGTGAPGFRFNRFGA